MFGYIYSIMLVVLFFVVAFVLVKLYEHGVRSWVVQSIVSVAIFAYFCSSPSEHIHSDTEKWVAFVIVLACIFVIDRPSLSSKHSKPKQQAPSLTGNNNGGNSRFQYFLDALLLYSIWSYFSDDDDNSDDYFC